MDKNEAKDKMHTMVKNDLKNAVKDVKNDTKDAKRDADK
ncbi:hypothetical protein ALNOE001_08040 [Candidatus Methanobinarius endosymbioticus]|uniref:Uncharacterized protein n=1 Tax=Candidatus Methanobinarius endosymbioticus TaxID=2006182 RepID=A0A366MBW8_9EURY|nr:hypothetical protein ALNOE001_08040 [Candidatus Methanobinarius endosymbioticus]